ncbi:MAG: chemotaxis protein CheD [Bacteroidales bacterium]|nr:chemotaxis protein CheD [Bacteroidales bacterium]MBN2758088.1 chemotaxis protein CheD [Bacteroidales bacterium]
MERPKHFLYPGAIFANTEPYYITTILGSCVAVCLYDPVIKIGGMNHFMLPLWNGQGLASPRYGNIAIKKIIEKLEALGSSRSNIKAKIFGGAEIIATNINQFMIGERNIRIAKDILHEENIQILSSSLGGKLGRKIIFDTYTGEVRQKYVGEKK